MIVKHVFNMPLSVERMIRSLGTVSTSHVLMLWAPVVRLGNCGVLRRHQPFSLGRLPDSGADSYPQFAVDKQKLFAHSSLIRQKKQRPTFVTQNSASFACLFGVVLLNHTPIASVAICIVARLCDCLIVSILRMRSSSFMMILGDWGPPQRVKKSGFPKEGNPDFLQMYGHLPCLRILNAAVMLFLLLTLFISSKDYKFEPQLGREGILSISSLLMIPLYSSYSCNAFISLPFDQPPT